MKIEERNGLRILYADCGYVLRNTQTGDIYTNKIYLGIHADPDIYEEIRDETMNDNLFSILNVLTIKEESLNKIGKLVASQVTDDVVALDIKEFYDYWKAGTSYTSGQYIQYLSVLYKVLITHISQADWTPDVSPSLFAKVLVDPTGETISEWVQPDSTNAYMTGDKVEHNEQIYVSTIDNNVWEPGVYGWEIVKEE